MMLKKGEWVYVAHVLQYEPTKKKEEENTLIDWRMMSTDIILESCRNSAKTVCAKQNVESGIVPTLQTYAVDVTYKI